MATLRRKKAEPFSVFQRDPGPWPPILLNWMATLAIIMVFGLVMLFSASYTTAISALGTASITSNPSCSARCWAWA